MSNEPKITVLNTEWNRKAHILEGAGKMQYLGVKNGMAYFTWTDLERGTIHLKCDAHFYEKNFRMLPVALEPDKELLAKTTFKIYPFDLVGK